MYQITVSEEIKNACPIFKGAAVYAEVTNTAFCEGLWEEINTFTRELTSTTQPEDIKRNPPLQLPGKLINAAAKTQAVTVLLPKPCAAV